MESSLINVLVICPFGSAQQDCYKFSKREVFNVGFLSSGVTWACLNAVGKMPVWRDVDNVCECR